AVALVVVGAGADDEGALPTREEHAAEGSRVARDPRDAEARNGIRGHGGRRLTDELGGGTPSASQGQRDVVLLNSRGHRDGRCGLLGGVEGVDIRIIKRVFGTHGPTLIAHRGAIPESGDMSMRGNERECQSWLTRSSALTGSQ